MSLTAFVLADDLDVALSHRLELMNYGMNHRTVLYCFDYAVL